MSSSLPSSAPQRYQIPTHLNVPDKIDLPLFGITISVTIRQALIGVLAGSLALQVWHQLSLLSHYGTTGLIFRAFFPGLIILAALLCATIKIADRHPEVWLALLIYYLRHPRVYVWKSVREERFIESPREKHAPTVQMDNSIWSFEQEEEEN